MNIRNISKELKPTNILIVYRVEKEELCYIEHREVMDNGVVLSGAPLSYDTAKKLFKEVNGDITHFKGHLSTNDIYIDSNKKIFAWHTKPNKYKIKFVSDSRKDSEEIEIDLPSIIFIIKNSSVRVYAYMKKGNILNTRLYKVPLPNIYADNSVCFGNVNIPALIVSDINELKENIENAFFTSQFTHFLEKTLNVEKYDYKNYVPIYKENHLSKYMIPIKEKLKELL